MSHPPDGPIDALSPEEWGARIDYDAWHDVYVPNDGVAEHHGGGSDYPAGRLPVDAFSQAREIKQLRDWESQHLSKGWRGLAYGYGIGQTGTIYRARGWHTYGAHTGDVDGDGIANNREIVPYIFIGSGHHHRKSQAAMDAIVRLRRFIELHSPKATYLWGHQELKGTATSCPGPFGMEYVRANRVLPLEEDMPLNQEDKDFILAAVHSDNVAQTEMIWTRFAIRDSQGTIVPLVRAIEFIYRKLEQGQKLDVDAQAVADALLPRINLRQA